ncbi:thiolase domain-containing protein [Patescibacteria group bacterium]
MEVSDVVVSGVGATKFGELWDRGFSDLVREAVGFALNDASLSIKNIDALVVGNMLLSQINNQAHVGAYAAESIGHKESSFTVEGACASGGLAIRQAYLMVKSGELENVLVVGVEKMTDTPIEEITTYLVGASSLREQFVGATFPGLYGLMQRKYIKEHGVDGDDFAYVSQKNHFHASKNKKAHFQREVSINQINESDMVADPIKLLHCSPISDGAAAVVLSGSKKPKKGEVLVAGSSQAGDSLSLSYRKKLTSLEATKKAYKSLVKDVGFLNEDVDLLEVHDCFSIAEVMALEDMGFCKAGKGLSLLKNGFGKLGSSEVVVNSSGGLKACGHPVGATGVKQVVEIVDQLKKRCGERQVKKPFLGITHNVGGTGATVVMHALRRAE